MNEIAIKNPGGVEAMASALMTDPIEMFGRSYLNMHAVDREILEKIQLAGLKKRFAQHRDRIPMLKKLADEQKVDGIEALDDVVPLLFSHTIYKSYPSVLLEKNRFTQLTQWLNKLTTVDLTQVDVSKCHGIDDWIDTLDAQTPLRLRHSSGTTGTVSFLPRSEDEAESHTFRSIFGNFQAAGHEAPTRDKPFHMHSISGSYRNGSTGALRNNDYTVKYVCGGDDAKFHALYPGRQSADLMYLAGRLRAAEIKGETVDLSPALLARKAEFEAGQRNRTRDTDTFYADLASKLRGERIFTVGTWNVFYNVASAGLKAGVENVFAPDSIVSLGGGFKGQVMPDDWEDQVKRFLGVPKLVHVYGMTEIMGLHKLCDHGHYHIEPHTILYVLDPDTGAALPRTGTQTGRAAFFDLLADTIWGGFVSGDEITAHWSKTCACGKKSPYIDRKVERYSDKRGGDDKISCAAASDAHETALNYLTHLDD